MVRNVFVVGMDDANLATMQGLPESRRYRFRRLLSPSRIRRTSGYDLDGLLDEAHRRLCAFPGSVDAIVTWWDFPSTCLVALLAQRWGVPGPDLRSIVALEHKYWSRLEQREAAGRHVPAFATFDPFDDDALARIAAQGVTYPFWVKPVKSVASYLSFRVRTPRDFTVAMTRIRAGIDLFAAPFQQALDRLDLPVTVQAAGARSCVAESHLDGRQATVEGFVSRGRVSCYGVVDSLRAPGSSSFVGYRYPSELPRAVQDRMRWIATAVVTRVGLDDSCFNAEFFHDEASDQVWLLEINPRASQSHCELFARVDGASSQRAILSVAQGRTPRMPQRGGRERSAGKLFLRAFHDGVVRRVPSPAEVARVAAAVPGALVTLDVRPGQRLAALEGQEPYSYELGHVFVGANTAQQLQERFERIAAMLPFDIDPVDAIATASGQ